MIISLYGLPASGKSSLAKELSSHLDIPMFSLGERIRKEVKGKSPIGKTMEIQLRNNGVLDSDLASNVVMNEIKGKQTMILDGFPRNVEQAKTFQRMSPRFISILIYLDCSKEIVSKRYINRDYNEIRDDLEDLNERIRVFYDNHYALLTFLDGTKCEILKIDGNSSQKKIFKDAIAIMNKLN
ncbi:MAG: nucleoside monophosphate kinase [Cyclobacteriaceae bacterium]